MVEVRGINVKDKSAKGKGDYKFITIYIDKITKSKRIW